MDANHCVKMFDEEVDDDYGKCLQLGLSEGNHRNPDNCETYYSCNPRCCYLMWCNDHLIFNSSTNQCDFPYQTKCCEYEAKHTDKLIQ